MKRHGVKKRLCAWISLCLIIGTVSVIDAQTPTPTPTGIPITLRTPRQTIIPAEIRVEMPFEQIQEWNRKTRSLYPQAELLASASRTYNCHGYAWHIAEGGEHAWIGTPIPYQYWMDGSYVTPVPGEHATKLTYGMDDPEGNPSDDHSAITTTQPDWVISKWGEYGPLMKHHKDYGPYKSPIQAYYRAADPPVQPFAATYGGTGAAAATALALSHDGGYIVAGNTTSFGASGTDAWLLKLAANGTIPFPNTTTHKAGGWQRRFGGTSNDYTTAVLQTNDYGYLVAGYTGSFGAGGDDGWLVKVDGFGNL